MGASCISSVKLILSSFLLEVDLSSFLDKIALGNIRVFHHYVVILKSTFIRDAENIISV